MIKGLEKTSNGQIKLHVDLELLESQQVNKSGNLRCNYSETKVLRS